MPAYGAYAGAPPETRRELGRLLRLAREAVGLSQIAVCKEVGTSATTLSRLESGERVPSPVILERIAASVAADMTEVFRLAGTVPPTAVQDVLRPELGQVLAGDLEARWQLRKLYLVRVAAEVTAGMTETPVDVPALLEERFNLGVQENRSLTWVRFGALVVEYPAGLRGGEAQRQLGHMAAHAFLAEKASSAPRCTPGTDSGDERDAEWLGGLIVIPRALLRTRFIGAAMNYRARLDNAPAERRLPPEEVLRRALMAALSDVASDFNVPLWLGTRHVADEGLLEFAYGQVNP